MSSDAAAAATVNNIWRLAQLVIYADLVASQIETMKNAEQRLREIADADLARAGFELDKASFMFARYTDKIVQCEDKLIALTCDPMPYEAKYDMAINRMQASVQSAFSEVQKDALGCASLWCYGATCASDRKLAIAKATAMAEAENAAIRVEDAKEEVDKEKIFSRLVNITNIGRGFGGATGASASVAAGIYGNIAQNAAAGVNSGLAAIGNVASQLFDPYKAPQQGYRTAGNGSQMTVNPESASAKNSESFANDFKQYETGGKTSTWEQEKADIIKLYEVEGVKSGGTASYFNYATPPTTASG